MAGAYDDRDGMIWMDGKLVDMARCQGPRPDPCAALRLVGLRGRALLQRHDLQAATSIRERLIRSGELLDMDMPYSAEEIDAAKDAMLKANGWTDAYVRAVAWRGSGEDMGVSASATRSASRSPAGNGATTTATPR